MNTHSCIKPGCGTQYEDNDTEAYYCPSCNDERKAIALEVDARIGSRSQKQPMSDLQAYDAAKDARGFVRAQDIM